MAEALQAYQEATSLLNDASPEALVGVCEHLKLTEDIEKLKDSKISLLRRVTRYLNAENIEKLDDQGEEIFKGICILLGNSDEGEQKGKDTKANVNTCTSSIKTSLPDGQLIQVTKREFKISGQIGEPGQKDRLSFSSLIHQVENAAKKGFGDEDIVEAVVRAVVPGSALRSYLEGLPNISLPVLRRILRAHFQEKGATELYHKLSNLSQDPKESAQSFLVRALDLRQRVIFASKEAGSGLRYDPSLVQSMLLHALLTGLRSEAVRNEVRPLLEDQGTTDEALFEKINEAAGREAERQHKLGTPARKAFTSSINGIEEHPQAAPEKPKPREGTLMSEIAELRAGMADVAVIRKQLSDLQNTMQTSKPPFSANQPSSRRRGCNRCFQENRGDTCDHCFRCGSSEHFARGCRNRNLNRSGNGERLLPRDEQ